MIKVSIVIPTYNAEAFIKNTIESVLRQTHSDFECIVVDDGSTDATLAVLENISDARIRIFKQANSGGPARPRNVGLEAAQGEYIFLLDADDVMLPEKLAISVAAFDENPDADILFSNFCSIDESGNLLDPNYLGSYDTFWRLVNLLPTSGGRAVIGAEQLYTSLVHLNFIGTSSVALRRASLTTSDRFNEELKNSDDRLFWINFSRSHNAIFINDVLHQYRIQPNGITNSGFLRRGPSKIKALKIIESECDDKKLLKVIKSQIANDYLAMAYSYKSTSNTRAIVSNAYKSISYKANFSGFKILVYALFRHLCFLLNSIFSKPKLL